MKRFYIIIILLSILAIPSYGQFKLKNLKQKAQKIKRDANRVIGNEEVQEGLKAFDARLEKSLAKFDTLSFNYAISMSDNAAVFASREKGEGVARLSKNLNSMATKEKDEQDKARRLLDVGQMSYRSQRYQIADTAFLAAKQIYEDQGITEDINYYKTLANLGMLYNSMGRYTASLKYTYQALELRRDNLGTQHSAYGASLNNLAVLYKDLGKYNEAEVEIEKSIGITQAAYGNDSEQYAITLNNKGHLFQTIGRYDEAEKYMNEAIAIAEKSLRQRSNNYLQLLTNLALLYQDMEQYDKAESTYQKAIDLQESKLQLGRKADPDYANMLNNLASLYVLMGKNAEVENLLKRSSEIFKKRFGEDHPSYANSISNLGNFYRYENKLNEAKPLLEKVLEIRENTLGRNHPAYVEAKEDMAILQWVSGNYPDAAKLYTEVLDKSLEFINTYFPPMSESEKTKYWDKMRPRFQRFYSFATSSHQYAPGLLGSMYDYQLATKALLLNAGNKVRQQILESGDNELIERYLTWLDEKETLAGLYSYSKEELREQNINLDSLERVANATEKFLSARSSLFSEGYTTKQVSHNELRNALGDTEAAIEVIQYPVFDNGFTDKIHYAALIVTKEQSKEPRLVLMENGGQLESRYYKYYKNAIQQQVEDEYSYDQYWANIEKGLKYKKRLYLSLDGIYNQINISTLRKADGTYVLSDFDFVLVSNSKDLIDLKASKQSRLSGSAFLLGFPDYGNTDAIAPLPGTKTEINNVDRMLKSKGHKTKVYQATEASERNIKAAKNPELLHIATHGYFLQDVDLNRDKVFGVETEKAMNNPLLRSGLMLAGAGNTISGIQNDVELASNDNGILTAYEAMNLSLDETDLVILSACETGLGDVKAGEGVYGLQRAFLVAGADAVIMSLWKVSDEATQQLMTNFYSYWLRSGNKLEAFKQAQLKLKEQFKEPYYWGAFVMIGS
ncbi:MAG: CHAT domain-containing tetratricopeptide repeat protein [Bacteroidota bacterium]